MCLQFLYFCFGKSVKIVGNGLLWASAPLAPGRWLVNPALLKTIWLMMLERCQQANTISTFKALESELTRNGVSLGFLLCLLGKRHYCAESTSLQLNWRAQTFPEQNPPKKASSSLKPLPPSAEKLSYNSLFPRPAVLEDTIQKLRFLKTAEKRRQIEHVLYSITHTFSSSLSSNGARNSDIAETRISNSNGLYMNVCFCERHEVFP